MLSSSDRLNQRLKQYNPFSPQCPDIRELTQLLCDVIHDEKVRILKSRCTLYRAVGLGHTEIITTILSSVPQHKRLDVLLEDEFTTLHWAARWGNSDSVETILTHLTPEQQQNNILLMRSKSGYTADRASRGGEKKTAGLLREYKLRAEKRTGGILMKLKHFFSPKRDTGLGNIKDETDTESITSLVEYPQVQTEDLPATTDECKVTALLLYSRVGREDGAIEEADILESGFRTQGSHVPRYEWITACDLQDKLHTFIQAVSIDCQMMFVCLMSHGAPGVLCGADGVKLPLNDLLDQLKALPAKLPLVMLVQACQNANTEPFRQSVELDAKFQATDASRASPPESSSCPHIDLTRPHTVLLRSTVTGGYSRRGAYTKALAHQIGSADGKKPIHEMHEDAVKAMRTKLGVKYMEDIEQVPEYRDTLQGKKLVLHKALNQ